MNNPLKGLMHFLPLMFTIISVLLLVFFVAFIAIWGFSTGIVLFLFGSVVLLVLQITKAVRLWKDPWLTLVPPALILFGWAGQYFSIMTIAPTLTVTRNPMNPMLSEVTVSLADSAVFTIGIVVMGLIVGTILAYALTHRK